MKNSYLWWLLPLVLVVVDVTADKSVTVGGITTQVLCRSGKIFVYKGSTSDGISIIYGFLEEIDSDDQKINIDSKHKFSNFGQLQCSFSELEETTYGSNNIAVVQFSFTATIPLSGQSATLKSVVLVFKKDGTIDLGGETIKVKEGDMKFNVMIEDWTFCGHAGTTCQTDQTTVTGKYLDFGMEIKRKGPIQTPADDSTIYGLGDGSVLILPKQVTYDKSITEDMPGDYPKLSTVAGKQMFVFRFKVFDESVFYDPIIGFDFDSDEIIVTTTTTTSTTSTTSTTTSTTSTTTTTPTTSEPEETLFGDGVTADVLGHSGKIRLTGTNEDGSSNGNVITVEFDNLNEVKSTGDRIKTSGHWHKTFANQEFEFSDITDGVYQGLDVTYLTFESTLDNSATLKVYLYIFKEAGNIDNDDETLPISTGMVKFTVEISNWAFCGDVRCTHGNSNEVGTDLEFEIVVKGSKSAKQEQSEPNQGLKFSLGSGEMILSKKFVADGSATMSTMATGYPKYRRHGSKDIFKLRFPKFTSNVLYDPVMSVNGKSDDDDDDDDLSGSSSLQTSLMAVIVLATAFVFRDLL